MCLPPVTVRVWPVIVSALSEVRNTIAFATSSGIASLLKGLFSAAQDQKPSNSKLLKPAYQYRLVSQGAAATAFTQIPNGANSIAEAFVNISKPAFVML